MPFEAPASGPRARVPVTGSVETLHARKSLSLAALSLLLLPACAGRAAPRNLLLITIDTLRADRLGCYGGPEALTPAIDNLAREGVLFSNAFSAIPITLPSHTSILTGLYPRKHKVLSHGYTLAGEYTTLAEILKSSGYQTGAFVSSHVLDKQYGLSQGFDIYWERYNYGKKRVEDAEETTGEDLLTQAAVDWVRLELKEPFFLWLHWFHPHKPYAPPGEMRTLYDPDPASPLRADVRTLQEVWEGKIELSERDVERFRSLYAGEVAFTDRQVGIFLAKLEALGLLENTIVVFTADHGEVLYEQDRYFGHDIMLYEPSIRVPLVLCGPGVGAPGRIVEATTRSVDLFPTILDLLGVPASDSTLDGRSFVPTLRGATPEEPPVFAEVFPPKEVWKTAPRHAVRLGDWKLIEIDGEDSLELFDLTDDPGETRNRASDQPERRLAMERLLRGWMASEGEVGGAPPELSAEEERNLKSLGYITE
jgi:arylsulfatase A-like enzyme